MVKEHSAWTGPVLEIPMDIESEVYVSTSLGRVLLGTNVPKAYLVVLDDDQL